MTDKNVFFSKADSVEMLSAFEKAQETFKYFWRELYWEYRRIVPALDITCVKVAFSQKSKSDDAPIIEHMWINEIDFDGQIIIGVLINDPNDLTNVKCGDAVAIPLSQISDWLFLTQGKTYGGFTIQVLRSEMNGRERKEHDDAWGVDFGNHNEVLFVYEQKLSPEKLVEHPMSIKMKEKFDEFLMEHPDRVTTKDHRGYTLLHKETIAGNATSVEALKKAGANIYEVTEDGKTALDFAKLLRWHHIIPLLTN